MGDHRLHRGHRDQHAHVHRRARHRLHRRLALPAARVRLRRRTPPHRRPAGARLLPRPALHLLRAAPAAPGRPRARALLRHLPRLAHAGRRHPPPRRRAGAGGRRHRWHAPGVGVHPGAGRGHDRLHRAGRRDGPRCGRTSCSSFVYLAGALVCLVAVVRLLPGGVGGALARGAGRGQATPPRFQLRRGRAVHVLGGPGRRRLPDLGHPRHRPLPRPAPAGGQGPQGRAARAGPDRAAGAGAVRVVPDAGHAAVGVLRRPRFARGDEVLPTFVATAAAAGRGGLHPGRDRGGGACRRR